MKIEFLNESCTEAIITRGWWRPKWTRVVIDEPSDGWRFTASGRIVRDVDFDLHQQLCTKRGRALRAVADGRDWIDYGAFPQARLVERKP